MLHSLTHLASRNPEHQDGVFLDGGQAVRVPPRGTHVYRAVRLPAPRTGQQRPRRLQVPRAVPRRDCPCVLAGRPCTAKCVCKTGDGDDAHLCRHNPWNVLEPRGITFEDLPDCTRQPIALEARIDFAELDFLLNGGDRDLTRVRCDYCSFDNKASFEDVCTSNVESDCGRCPVWSRCRYRNTDRPVRMYDDDKVEAFYCRHYSVCGECGDKRERHCPNPDCDRCFNGNLAVSVPCDWCCLKADAAFQREEQLTLLELLKAVKDTPDRVTVARRKESAAWRATDKAEAAAAASAPLTLESSQVKADLEVITRAANATIENEPDDDDDY